MEGLVGGLQIAGLHARAEGGGTGREPYLADILLGRRGGGEVEADATPPSRESVSRRSRLASES
jgi:hypothetical protein